MTFIQVYMLENKYYSRLRKMNVDENLNHEVIPSNTHRCIFFQDKTTFYFRE